MGKDPIISESNPTADISYLLITISSHIDRHVLSR